MKFLQLSKSEIETYLNRFKYNDLIEFAKFIDDETDNILDLKKIHTIRKSALVDYLCVFLTNTIFVENIYKKLTSSDAARYVYENLVWERDYLETQDVETRFGVKFLSEKTKWGSSITYQKGLFVLIQREQEHFYNHSSDRLYLRENFRPILRLLFPAPPEIELLGIEENAELESCCDYSNEEHIFRFIDIISQMLQNNLVEFGKTNEKPLSKTLGILKSTTGIEEFFIDKKLSLLATDMLTRSFFYYYRQKKGFKANPMDTLQNFLLTQFDDKIDFFISRIFLSHLKKIRYDRLYLNQFSLFKALKKIISKFPKKAWVDIENIIKFCKYRDIRIDLEREYKTSEYYMDSEIVTDEGVIEERLYARGEFYDILFFEPLIKASFFYLGAMGLFELKYDEPYSPYTISAKGKPYISPWDMLEYVRMTELGEYIFGVRKNYEPKTDRKKSSTALKFDEFKPIITIDPNDTLSLAKLEPYCDKYDTNRYALSYTKIFKDCKNKKELDVKIEHFYKHIAPTAPKVFQDFFNEIKQNANLLKKDTKRVVIELEENEKLLDLFIRNKKLQELVIKAQGYKVLVEKENVQKLTKIVKEHGFFVEF